LANPKGSNPHRRKRSAAKKMLRRRAKTGFSKPWPRAGGDRKGTPDPLAVNVGAARLLKKLEDGHKMVRQESDDSGGKLHKRLGKRSNAVKFWVQLFLQRKVCRGGTEIGDSGAIERGVKLWAVGGKSQASDAKRNRGIALELGGGIAL